MQGGGACQQMREARHISKSNCVVFVCQKSDRAARPVAFVKIVAGPHGAMAEWLRRET